MLSLEAWNVNFKQDLDQVLYKMAPGAWEDSLTHYPVSFSNNVDCNTSYLLCLI